MTHLHFQPLSYPGADVRALIGPTPWKAMDGIAKWNEIDRPRRRALTEFAGESPLKQSGSIVLDAFPDGDIEHLVARIRGWAARNSLTYQPTLLKVSGPISYTELTYFLSLVEETDLMERRDDGRRCRQELKLEITEYVSADIAADPPPPAHSAQERARLQYQSSKLRRATGAMTTSPAERTVTVKRGDTLWQLAVQHLGAGSRWKVIADANGIRDPTTIKPGQVLRVPSG